jgi:putative ATPase
MSLFDRGNEPLASRLRPKSFGEIYGQDKTISILSKLKRPLSLILYGPPGTGKTSLARILRDTWNLAFFEMSATDTGTKDIKDLIKKTESLGSILLFMDEIHRFNSLQQDSFLESVEKGKIYLIGATTENPAFRINRALLSRCHVYQLKPLEKAELKKLYLRALELSPNLKLEEDSLEFISTACSGDARRFLSILELLDSIEKLDGKWTKPEIEEILSSQILEYDKNKDNHYDYISAFIKSVRGSDPDAALYYLATMLEAGEDPIFLFRRLIILASEDIGNASIYALIFAEAALSAFEKIGMPEGRILLAQVTTFLASCPKSNASYLSIDEAIRFVQNPENRKSIPLYLRNAPTSLHKKQGNSIGYKYPHQFQNAFVEEFYFPEDFKKNPPQFYFPSEAGNEKSLRERLLSIWKKTGWKKYER